MRFAWLVLGSLLSIAAYGLNAAETADGFADWAEYTSPDGQFRLLLPVEPMVTTSKRIEAGLPLDVIDVAVPGGAYGLTVFDFRRDLRGQGEALLNRLSALPNGITPVYSIPVSSNAVAGRETLTFQSGAWVRQRYFFSGTRFYNLIALSLTRNDQDPVATHFLESLVIN